MKTSNWSYSLRQLCNLSVITKTLSVKQHRICQMHVRFYVTWKASYIFKYLRIHDTPVILYQ